MKRLRVAVFSRRGNAGEQFWRVNGLWSYSTDEFAIAGRKGQQKDFRLNLRGCRGFDLVVLEDDKLKGAIITGKGPPVLFHSWDTTLGAERREYAAMVAKQVTCTLVDHDDLDCVPGMVLRCGYAVNDRMVGMAQHLKPPPIDVCFVCRTDAACPRRAATAEFLRRYCRERGLTYSEGTRFGVEYLGEFCSAKLVVHVSRTPENRAHRLYDASACGATILSTPFRQFDCDLNMPTWNSFDELVHLIEKRLASRETSTNLHVLERHCWSARARELREQLAVKLGI